MVFNLLLHTIFCLLDVCIVPDISHMKKMTRKPGLHSYIQFIFVKTDILSPFDEIRESYKHTQSV